VTDERVGVERIEGESPAGGAYSVASFSDDRGRPCPKERASRVVITEYDSEDRRLAETWAVIGPAEADRVAASDEVRGGEERPADQEAADPE
jgi:hypothetical protein